MRFIKRAQRHELGTTRRFSLVNVFSDLVERLGLRLGCVERDECDHRSKTAAEDEEHVLANVMLNGAFRHLSIGSECSL